MTINRKKFDELVKKLYNAKLKRFQQRIQSTGKRINPTDPQGKTVTKTCNYTCFVCEKKYTIDSDNDFQIHHIDGDRSNTHTKNLVLLCKQHHADIEEWARSLLKDWKIKHSKKEVKEQKNQFDDFKSVDPMFGMSRQIKKKTDRNSSKSKSPQKTGWSFGV